ncbi:sodium- and chloride-dependent GABA transporter 2-like [Mytilus galloprovincialis]|uniref:sodium- and chloride-dependent GABA transporter 2-like n=1 Tax=Mytilus galloprovincialis TaxID=29158 RepID=UPI003F7B6B78
MNDLGLEQQEYSAKWDLVQFFFLATYTVGLHGTTSLPFYIQKYTVLFLVAYYVLLILICIPICYLQIKLGAIYRHGIVGIFSNLIPFLKGGAVALLVMTFIRCLTSGLELSYSLYFSFVSFDSFRSGNTSVVRPTEYGDVNRYFHEKFLQRSDGIAEPGHMIWYLLLCLLATWIVIYLLTFKGTAIFAKSVYGLTTTAFILLLVVLVYGRLKDNLISYSRHYVVTGENEITEIQDVRTVSVVHLGSPELWVDALLLHMNSIGLWSGVLPLLGTRIYNKKVVVNSAVALLIIAYSIFPVVTYIALEPYYDMSWDEGFIALQRGIKPGLSYLFLGVFSTVRHHPVIALCLFMFCFLFGMIHQVIHLCVIWESLLPSLPKMIMKRIRRREYLIGIACFSSFLLSILFITQGGLFVYMLVNSYVDRLVFTLIIVSTVPIITGYLKQESLYLPVERVFMSAWYGLASLIPAGMLIYYFALNVYPYSIFGYDEQWAEKIGWIISISPISCCMILGAVHAIYKGKGNFKQKCIQALKADSLNATDSYTEENSETNNTGFASSKSPSNSVMGNKNEPETNVSQAEKAETEIVMRPPEFTEVVKV